MPLCTPVAKTIPHDKNMMTLVRIAVARFESTPFMPIFAKIDVSAANKADNTA